MKPSLIHVFLAIQMQKQVKDPCFCISWFKQLKSTTHLKLLFPVFTVHGLRHTMVQSTYIPNGKRWLYSSFTLYILTSKLIQFVSRITVHLIRTDNSKLLRYICDSEFQSVCFPSKHSLQKLQLLSACIQWFLFSVHSTAWIVRYLIAEVIIYYSFPFPSFLYNL